MPKKKKINLEPASKKALNSPLQSITENSTILGFNRKQEERYKKAKPVLDKINADRNNAKNDGETLGNLKYMEDSINDFIINNKILDKRVKDYYFV